MALSVVAAGATAQAAEQSVDWVAPADCSNVQQVMAVVTELTGQDPVVIPPDRRIEGLVEASGRGWRLSLSLRDGAQRRSRVISAPSCPELARAAGVALALALDPNAVSEVPAPEAAAESSPADPESAAGAAGAAIDSELRDGIAAAGLPVAGAAVARQPEWRLEAGALLDAVALGAASPGAEVSLGLRSAALSGSLYGAWLPARREGVAAGGAVEFALLAGGVRGCYELARGLLAADACAGVEVGRLAASGKGLDQAASYTDWWLAPGVGISFGSALAGPLYFRAGADALLPVLREAYRVNDGVLVQRAPSIGFRGGVALGVVIAGGG